VFSRSFFAPPEEFAAAELVAMFHTYFVGSREGLLFDVPSDDYDTALWGPLGRYLTGRGVRIRTASPVTSLTRRARGWRVTTGREELEVDAVVLAADPRGTRELVAGLVAEPRVPAAAAEAQRRWRARVAAQRNAPPFAVLRLWLDGHVDPTRAAFLGTSGHAVLDNVTVLERFEDGARAWSRRHGGSVIELHAYALEAGPDGAPMAPERLRELLLADLRAVYPETAGLGIVAEQLRLDDDCGLAGVEPRSEQPGVTTPFAGLVLAGDRIVCDYPVALMERAATTGLLAANALLEGWGVRGHEVVTPPLEGLLRRGVLGRLRAAAPTSPSPRRAGTRRPGPRRPREGA
jgi:isorenieratene synthase